MRGSATVLREMSQLTERCGGYEGGVRRCGKVGQLSGSVTGGLSVGGEL